MKYLLIAVSNDKVLFSLSQIFDESEFEIFTARNVNDSLRIINEVPPDLIISEAFSEESVGIMLHERVRDEIKLKATPMLLLTESNYTLPKEIHSDNFVSYIYKPLNRDFIVNTVNKFIEESSYDNYEFNSHKTLDELQLYNTKVKTRRVTTKAYRMDFITDSFNRQKILTYQSTKKEKKEKLYFKLTDELEGNQSQEDKKQLDISRFIKMVERVADSELRKSDLTLHIQPSEAEINEKHFSIAAKEIIENAFKHSWSYSPVEVICIQKADEYVLSVTNYSSKSLLNENNDQNKYGIKIVETISLISGFRFQITQVANNCVKSRLSIKIS